VEILSVNIITHTYCEPIQLTVEETKQQKITALDAEYSPQFDALILAWATASMSRDTVTANARVADKAALTVEYTTKGS